VTAVNSDLGPELVSQVFNATTGVWTLVGLAIVALVRTWPLILARLNERKRDEDSERAGDWERLRDEISRLAKRVEALEAKVDECEAERDAALRRAVTAETELVKLEAYQLGKGEARQKAQIVVSEERLKDQS